MSAVQTQRVRFKVNGQAIVGTHSVAYEVKAPYEYNILVLDDYVTCGRADDMWVCIDKADGDVFYGELAGVMYYFTGGKAVRVVENGDVVAVETKDGDVLEFSDMY